METQSTINTSKTQLDNGAWLKLGLTAAIVGALAVVIVQIIAIALWPEIALFKPLDSLPRSAVFTIVPALGATALLAWLSKRSANAVKTFIIISAVVLVLSFIPDYVLPVPHKTMLASTATAFLHLVAAATIMPTLIIGYKKQTGA